MFKMKVVLLVSVLFLLTGCSSGISQEDYDESLRANEELTTQLEELTAKNEELTNQNQEQLSEIDSLNDELLTIKTDSILEDLPSDYVSAWITSSFGENAMYSEIVSASDGSSSNYLQCIIPTNYDETNMQDIYNGLIASVTTLTLLDIKYDKVALKYLDSNNGELLEIVLSYGDGFYGLDKFLGDLTRSSTISAGLNSAGSE